MDDYLDVPYILLDHHYRTWDPHLCHWDRFDKIHDACVYGPHNDILSQMYKHFHDSLMRYLLDVQLYDVFMYFNDLYFVLMMFGRVQNKQCDLGIAWFKFWKKQVVGDIESPLEKVIVMSIEKKQAWWFLFENFLEY